MREASVLRIRGVVLPDEVERDLYIADGVIREAPVAHAETIADGGWILPGLVDMHTHPGALEPGTPFDAGLFEQQLADHLAAGVLTVRCPGLAARAPARSTSSPHVIAAGPWIASRDGFFSGWGRQVEVDEIPAVVEEEARSAPWVKIVADWGKEESGRRVYAPTVPPDVVAEAVRRAHDAGARVAVHTQHRDGAEAAVRAGADSIEHGMNMAEDLLATMAEEGIAFVPTMHALSRILDATARVETPDAFVRYLREGAERHPSLVRAAWEAGVVVLAGTDSPPFGNVAAEVEALRAAGLPADAALGAASWDALRYLGQPGIGDGVEANLVIYDEDPRDPAVLRRPARVIAGGKLIR